MKIKNPIDELQSTSIWKYLQKIDDNYAQIAIQFLQAISPILASIHEVFPYYTRHDAHHGYRVLLRIQEIVHKDCFNSGSKLAFSPDEALLLICSSYAHDLGMAVFPNEEQELLPALEITNEPGWKNNPVLQNYLRANHSTRGGKFIAEHVDSLDIPRNLVSLLDKLMEAHNLTILELDVKLGQRFSAGAKEIFLKQLACILCVADALEFSETRVVDGVIDTLKERMSEIADPALLLSFRHNMQAVCIGNGVAIGKDGKIIFTGTFDDPEVVILSHNTIDLIETWIRDYTDIDFQSDLKRLHIRGGSVVRQLDIPGYDFERIGIRMRKDNIIDLIASNATWTSDAAIVVRKLLQNSVEACRYRLFHSSTADAYQPKIDVYFHKKDRTITICDNGCGMSRNIILNNFLTVGNSRSFDPSYVKGNYATLARFGIGFWSVFTVCDNAIIRTAPFEYYGTENAQDNLINGVQFEVSIREFKDYTVFTSVNMEAGTSIVLHLKASFNMEEAIYKLSYHIGCSAIPIEVHTDDQSPIVIPWKIELPDFKTIFVAKSQLCIEAGVQEFLYEHCENDIDIRIKFFYSYHRQQFSFMFPGTTSQILSHQGSENRIMKRFTGICGFLFNYSNQQAIIDFRRVGLLGANALNPKGYQFTLNRMGVVKSPQYEIFGSTVSKHIHTAYRKMLIDHHQHTAEDIIRINIESRSNGGEHPGAYTHGSLLKFHQEVPDLVGIKLYKIEAGSTFQDCETICLRLEELSTVSYELWLWSTPIYEIRFNFENGALPRIYERLKTLYPMKDNSYLVQPSLEADMIADNAIDCEILVYHEDHLPYAIFPFRKFHSDQIIPHVSNEKEICDVRGIWTGTIVKGVIRGANFAFLSREYLVVQKDSLLANRIIELYDKKIIFKICEIVNALLESRSGIKDDSIVPIL